MFIADSLYGGMQLPDWTDDLVLTPEVQRLRGIRLINSSSPSLTSISDARRYTHTLGVVWLALAATAHDEVSRQDASCLVAAAVCHDLATPPFGHLFEYLLGALTGWSHEEAVLSILEGTYRPEGEYHQIMRGRELKLGRVLRELDLDLARVAEFARGKGGLGSLVAGSIDLDNIDNVFRMAHLLGLGGPSGEEAISLAGSLRVTSEGKVWLPAAAESMLGVWASTRKRVYEVLAFDETNLKGQTMLTDCLVTAMEVGDVTPDHWFWTDEWLLYRLDEIEATKDIAHRFSSGDLYESVFIGWYSVPRGDVDWRHPQNRNRLRDALESELGFSCSPYVFYDSGTFCKTLDVSVAGDTTPLTATSRSSIVGVFTPRRNIPSSASVGAQRVLEEFGFARKCLKTIPDKEAIYGLPGQTTLPF